MKKILLLMSLLSFTICVYGQEVLDIKLVKLKNGSPLTVSSHAAPSFYDMNGDGKLDLLVGDFGSTSCSYNGKSWSKALCRVFINKGSDEKPIYDEPYILQAGGEDAYVHVT